MYELSSPLNYDDTKAKGFSIPNNKAHTLLKKIFR